MILINLYMRKTLTKNSKCLKRKIDSQRKRLKKARNKGDKSKKKLKEKKNPTMK